MVAIFGPDQRADATPLRDRTVPARTNGRRRVIVAALSLCGVATMLTAGVVGGTRVFDAVPQGERSRGDLARDDRRPSRTPPQPVAVAGADRPAPVPVSDPPMETAAAPVPETALPAAPVAPPADMVVASTDGSRYADVADAPATRTDVVVRRGAEAVAPQRVAVLPAGGPRNADRMPRADEGRPAVAFASTRRTGCATVRECLQPQLRAGEQGVAAAYQRATIAGVRAKTLREYRDEWIRARGLAVKRPQEAIRIYGMIGSDLRLLASDPTIE